MVNNAGGAKGLDSIHDANIDDWTWMYETNVLGTLRVTKALMDGLIARDGHVINIGSIAGENPYIGGAGYNAAKFGVAAFNRVLRLETHQQTLRMSEIDGIALPRKNSLSFVSAEIKNAQKQSMTTFLTSLQKTSQSLCVGSRAFQSI